MKLDELLSKVRDKQWSRKEIRRFIFWGIMLIVILISVFFFS